jgi:peroxiredoxin
MNKYFAIVMLMIVAVVVPATVTSAAGTAKVGQPGPDFTAADSTGTMHHLSEYRGKFVVLEWHNNGCPYTRKHYESGNMQQLQKEWTAKGVIWLTVISSAPGQQGFVTPAEENDYMAKMHAVPTAALLDPTGQVGHLYDAKTTPDMFVINSQGVLVYDGAIDNRPTSDQSDVQGAENYVSEALTAAMAGKPVQNAVTRPYGCSVKYGGSMQRPCGL